MKLTIAEKLSQEPKLWRKQLIIVFICLLLLIWSSTALKVQKTDGSGIAVALGIFKGLVHPTTSLLFGMGKTGVAYLLLETMCIALMGTIVGAIFAIPISFISSFNIVPKWLGIFGRVFIMAIRTIPAFVYGLMFIMVTGPGPFAGLLTMSLCSVGMLSKMFIEAIEDLDKGILESLDAQGCTFFQKIRYGIIPQLLPSFASTLIYRFDMNLRDATVLGLVGAGGIGAPLIFAMSSYRWNDVGAILIGLVVLVLIVEALSGKLRTKLMRG
ncbi:MAG: phosphonate ABC transporter, permease protein PhnE [Spirochaetales bacterium]|nr:phosphonate ABC transporter, permease protein PhnE [Spirochaetales bacterium]